MSQTDPFTSVRRAVWRRRALMVAVGTASAATAVTFALSLPFAGTVAAATALLLGVVAVVWIASAPRSANQRTTRSDLGSSAYYGGAAGYGGGWGGGYDGGGGGGGDC